MNEHGDKPIMTGTVSDDITPLYRRVRAALVELVRIHDSAVAHGVTADYRTHLALALVDAKNALNDCAEK